MALARIVIAWRTTRELRNPAEEPHPGDELERPFQMLLVAILLGVGFGIGCGFERSLLS